MSGRAWFAIIALGHDRPGIVADLSGCVFECGYNLEDASMTMLGSEFAVLMLVSGKAGEASEHERLREAMKRLEWEKELTVFVRALDGEPRTPGRGVSLHLVTAVGVDRAGIVAGVSGCLARRGIGIDDLRGSVSEAPQSGTPVYTLHIRASVSPTVDLAALDDELASVGQQLDVEIRRSPAD